MADTPERIQTPEGKTRLIKHFEKRPISTHNDAWSNLWDTNNDDMWDRGKPSPALIDLIETRPDIITPLMPDGRRRKVLIPGCGKGYDAVMLSLHGYIVTGLEISAKGIETAKQYARHELAAPQSYNFRSTTSTATISTGISEPNSSSVSESGGSVEFIQGDFFDESFRGQFDVIYDYTFLCALHPSMRKQWSTRMASLLTPGGLLICLQFPLFKEPSVIGPPWPLQGVYWDLLVAGGDGVVYPDRIELIEEEKNSDGESGGNEKGLFERRWYFRPAVSYESGKGTDMVGIYVRK